MATDATGTERRWIAPGRRLAAGVVAVLLAAGPVAAGSKRRARVRVASNPPGALLTAVPENPRDRQRVVFGLTPTDAEVALGASGTARLQVEKRGFVAETLTVDASTGAATIELRPSSAATDADPALAAARAVVLVGPGVELVRRGFSREQVSAEGSASASDALAAAIAARLGTRIVVHRLRTAEAPAALLRDAGAAAALNDPVRLPFLEQAPRLETAAGRRGAAEVGEGRGARPLLLVTGRSSVETGGMKAGKLGIMVAGTASSYGAGYSRALSGGGGSFTYSIYLPASTGGTRLDAVLVDAATGEVLWINRGVYAPLDPDRHERAAEIIDDLLTGLPLGTTVGSSNHGD